MIAHFNDDKSQTDEFLLIQLRDCPPIVVLCTHKKITELIIFSQLNFYGVSQERYDIPTRTLFWSRAVKI